MKKFSGVQSRWTLYREDGAEEKAEEKAEEELAPEVSESKVPESED